MMFLVAKNYGECNPPWEGGEHYITIRSPIKSMCMYCYKQTHVMLPMAE